MVLFASGVKERDRPWRHWATTDSDLQRHRESRLSGNPVAKVAHLSSSWAETMMKPLLIVDDDPRIRESLSEALAKDRHHGAGNRPAGWSVRKVSLAICRGDLYYSDSEDNRSLRPTGAKEMIRYARPSFGKRTTAPKALLSIDLNPFPRSGMRLADALSLTWT